MNGGEFIERFRQDMTDEETPPLWSDALILRYLTDTQEDFCRLTEGIPDSMSSICRVTAAASKGIVRLSRKIKKIRAATLESTGAPIDVTSVEDARRNGVSLTAAHSGTPRMLITGIGPCAAQVYPLPTTDSVIRLDVFRAPLEKIGNVQDELEVDYIYAPVLMLGVMSRAYARADIDTMDRARADQLQLQFERGCALAAREQGRARKPNGATQFSW